MYALLLCLHIIGITLWVGGMLFAHFALRPALPLLEAPQRLTLMAEVMSRFLNLAGLAVIVVLGSGVTMMVMAGGHAVPLAWHIMSGLGVVMGLLYGHIRFAPFKRFVKAVTAQDWAAAAQALASVRLLVSINMVLGLLTIAVATLMGRA